MFKARNAKRFGAIVIALGITFVANYAISFAARSGQSIPGATPRPRVEQVERSGQSVPGATPRPMQERSGQSVPGATPRP